MPRLLGLYALPPARGANIARASSASGLGPISRLSRWRDRRSLPRTPLPLECGRVGAGGSLRIHRESDGQMTMPATPAAAMRV
jgi:hypothetical protein